jgi:hypothetical protein
MNLNHLIRRKINRLTAKWLAVVMTCAAWMLTTLPAAAQTIHPVTASLQLVPPYSVYLADYAAPGNDKLRVILTLNDLSQASYTIRLRIKVELNGRTIMQTDPAWRPSGITLLPGMPQVIAGAQLQDYLVTNHLQFLDGFSKDNYERTKALPEGAYRICIMAYDYYRNDNVAVSNEGCNIFFFQKKEPPVLNTPLCNTRVDRKDPQFLTFNWSMRNTPSPFAGASGTGYRFELFEVRPAGSNPEYIVRSSKPIYTATTDGLMLVYGPGEPRLMDSMQYVWRVQAFDKDGRDAYQNNGYSPACVFTYGGVDPFMAANIGRPELFGESLGERSGKWWWHISNGKTVDGWNIQYRKQAATSNKNDAHEWNKQYVTDSLLHLFNLEAENTYEAQVQPVIRGITGSWSETTVFKTLPKRVYECGKNDTAAFGLGQAGAGQPLNSAVAGMVIRVGDFDMQLLQVSGGNGRFTGYGAVATPLLGLRLNVKFADAVINDRLHLTQGEVIALSDGIDAWIKDRTQVGRDVDVIKTWTEKMPDFETASLPVLVDFARELLGISDDIWKDTYVFTEAERKDVQDALAEVKAAMKDLEDGNPDNDAAAEKKLRTTLKKAKPLLEKLSNNIGKGVLVQLGLIREKFFTAIINEYIEDLESATVLHEKHEQESYALRGPRTAGDDVFDFWQQLPSCFESLNKQEKQALASYLKGYKKDAQQFKKMLGELDAAIKEGTGSNGTDKRNDNAYFEDVEKQLKEWADKNGDTTVNGLWSPVFEIKQSGYDKWREAKERFCKYLLQLYNKSKQETQLTGGVTKAASRETFEKYYNGSIGEWFRQHNISAKVYVKYKDRNTLKVYGDKKDQTIYGDQLTNSDQVGQPKETPEDKLREFNRGSFEEHVGIWAEYDEVTGKMSIYIRYRKDFLKPAKYANGRSGAWFEQKIKEKLEGKLKNSDWDKALTNKEEEKNGDDGRYRMEEMHVLEWVGFAADEVGFVVNTATVNPNLWNDMDNKAAYDKSAMNLYAPLAGGADVSLEQLKDLYELVDFVGDIVAEPSQIKDIYTSVTSLTVDDMMGMIKKAYEEKKALYEKGGTVRQYHASVDGIQATIMVLAAAKEGAKLVTKVIKKSGGMLQSMKKIIKEIPHTDIKKRIKDLDEALAKKFVETFDGIDNKLKEMLKLNPKVFDAWERVAKADLPDLKLVRKKFPERDGSWVLEQAKKYQGKFSGDADLSFDYKGVSFDDFKDGVLVDAKFGHGKSIFNDLEGDFGDFDVDDIVKNDKRRRSILDQAKRQLDAVEGSNVKIQWKISSELGQKGIARLFQEAGYNIEVLYEAL